MIRNSALANAVTALDTKMRRELRRHLAFSKFMGNLKEVPNPNNDLDLRPSESVIEISRKKADALGDRMIFPMLLGLTGPGRRGDSVLIGYEEDFARKYMMIAYTQIRHAVPVQKGKKDYSNEKILNMMEYALPELAWWHAQQEQWEILSAFHQGVGEMLYTPVGDATYGNGLGLDKRYHPNLYTFTGATDATAALGLVTATAGTFPTVQRVRDAAKNVSYSDHSTDLQTDRTFTTYTGRAARNLALSTLNLRPLFTYGGQKFFGMYISPEQADTLRNDERFQNAMKTKLWENLADNPLVNGSIGVYDQIVYFEDPIVVRGYAGSETNGSDLNILGSRAHVYSATAKSNPRFEPMEGHITEAGGKKNHVAILFGASALGKSLYDELGFEEESFDYNNWKGVGASQMYGYGRFDAVGEADIMKLETSSSTITDVYNRSSALIMTWQ